MTFEHVYVFVSINGVYTPAGLLRPDGREGFFFRYGNKYLERENSFSLDPATLPLTRDEFYSQGLFNVFRDAAPDSLMYSEEFDILPDWQGSSLEEGPEAEERILKIRAVKDKAPLTLISIEDLIIDRLEAYTYGNDREALGWVHALFLVGKEGNFPMHRERIEKLAVRADVESALEKMLAIGENGDDESPRP